MNIYDTLDAAFIEELRHILETGEHVAPRALGCTEAEGRCFRLSNPRARLITLRARKWSLPYAIGELCWHLSASDELEQISYYSKKWTAFADSDEVIRGSCYGRKLFDGQAAHPAQWERMKSLLRADPSSRRAVLSIMAAEDLAEAVEAADVPCCTTLQFLLRDGRLNLITYMRSNDIFTGFGYDIFFFTMLQELLACELEVALGWYQHVVGSLHLYDQDRRRALAAIESSPDLVVMPPMTNPADLKRVLHYEKEIRRGALLELAPRSDVSEYWQPFLGVLLFHRYRRTAEEGRMREVLTHTRSGWTHPLLELLV